MPTSFNRLEILRQHIAIPLKAFEADGTEHVLNGLTFAQGTGAKTLYIPSDPSQNTGVHITHDAADTPLVDGSFTIPAVDDLEDAAVMWFSIYDGTSTFYAGADERPLSGMRITLNPATDDIKISAIQTRRKR